MNEAKKIVAAFDFDGTVTRKDSFMLFIKFAKGKSALHYGLIRFSPQLIAYKLHLYPNWKIKQKLFAHFFKNMTLYEFNNLGQQFLNVIQPIVRPKALDAIQKYISQHADIYVVTASIENWVKPWALSVGITNTIATQVEINEHGLLTGRFLTKNCYGIEKVNRLLQFEPRRENYTLHAFGDSRGDRELLALADLKHYKYF